MPLLHHITLVAAAEWWEVLAGIIFFVLYGLGQLMSAREEAKKKKAAPKRPKPEQPPFGQQPVAAGERPDQADPLRAEVEEFLRRAQGKQAEPRRPAQPQAAPPRRQPQRSAREAASRTAPPVRQPQRPPSRPPQFEPVEARIEGVAEHVSRNMSTEDIAEQSSKLGADVALADDRLEARLHETFQQKIGQFNLTDQGGQTQRAPTIAEEIRQLVREPAGMRQLIIANEVLRRPEERW